jgi:hypothetical protein
MTADTDFERRVRSELRSTLDRLDGPHRDWETSPASAVVATEPERSSRSVPWRLLAIAAVLVVGSVAAGILAKPDIQQDAGVPGCPTLADYAAASAHPASIVGQAPGVTFPPVAPSASITTGLLQPGDWAVIANDAGPGLQIRVRDVRECGRLPDVRSQYAGGSIILATVDSRALRDDTGMAWLGVIDLVEPVIGDVPVGWPISRVDLFGVPGVDIRTHLHMTASFANSSTLVMDVPATDKMITVDHPGVNTQTLPGLEWTGLQSPRVRWLIRDGVATGLPPREPMASPGATATTGEVPLGEDATVLTSNGPVVMRLSDVDTVRAYPGLIPAAGNVFVEVRIEERLVLESRASGGSIGWRAIGAGGRALKILQDEDPSEGTSGVIRRLLPPTGTDVAWIVIEAPETGPIRLEYRQGGTADKMFWVRVRD